MYAVSNIDGVELFVAPRLAVVHTTRGTSYVPRTCDYKGFLAQRYYRGVGLAHRWYDSVPPGKLGGQLWEDYSHCAPYYRPVLNRVAVEEAGLVYSEVVEWANAYGEATFTHPTYAPLCLRWGANTYGSFVSELKSPVDQSMQQAICFTARTNPVTREHHYHLESPLLAGPLLTELQQAAGLELRSWRAEYRRGGYSTRLLEAAQRVVIGYGYRWAWAHRCSVYWITVQFPTTANRSAQRWCFATAEEAQAWYDQLPVGPNLEDEAAYFCPIATLNSAERLFEEVLNQRLLAEKCLALDWEAQFTPPNADKVAALIASGVRRENLTAEDDPYPTPFHSLATLLDRQALSAADTAAALGLTLSKLQQRLQDPTLWTVGELNCVAHYTNWLLPDIISLLDLS